MQLLAMSDLHGHLPKADELPDCDVLIVAGDCAPDFLTSHPSTGIDPGTEKQAEWFGRQFDQWLRWNEKLGREVVWIGGNHDYALEKYPNLGPTLAGHYLMDSAIELEGVKFYGTPWVPHLRFWAFYAHDELLKEKTESIPVDTDILISHGPPYGYGDMCGPKWGKEEPVGSKPLDSLLYFLKVKALVCGHIHEGAGIYRHDNTVTEVCNVAIRDEKYQVVRGATDISYVLESHDS